MESCAFTYDGGANLSVTITGADTGVTYRMVASDSDSAPQSVLAVTSTVIINITDIGGDPAGYMFRALVSRLDDNSYVGCSGFDEGTPGEATRIAAFAADGADPPVVSCTFPSELGTDYYIRIISDAGQTGAPDVAGTGDPVTITRTGLTTIVGSYVCQLSNRDTGEDIANRLFTHGAVGGGLKGNPLLPVAGATFDFDHVAGVATAHITGATIGSTYRFTCFDPSLGTDTQVAATEAFDLVVTGIGGFSAGEQTFGGFVEDLTTGASVGNTVFDKDADGEFTFDAVWDFNGTNSVSVTFFAESGVTYELDIYNDSEGEPGTPYVGTGAQHMLTTTHATAFILPFTGELFQSSGDYNDFTTRMFAPDAAGEGSPGNPSGDNPPVGSFESPLWRYFLANLDGEGIVDLSRLASDRVVEVVLNAPLSMTGTVPSDNPEVWLTDATDDDPFLAVGTRLMWGFRREGTPTTWVPRAATLVQLIEDTAAQDDARSRFTGYDPWRYLFARPVCDADGNLPGKDGMSFAAGTEVAVVVATLLGNTIANQGHAYIDAGVAYIGTGFYTGTLDPTPVLPAGGITFQQGTSVGAAWQQLTDTNLCDIWLEPIYDPFNRPNYLCQLNVYAQAGEIKDEQVFAWNAPGRSLVGLSRLQDMTQAANEIVYYTGQGGVYNRPTGPIADDPVSVAKYGEYWAQQFFPGQTIPTVVLSLAERQLALRKTGKETVTFRPAPERSPRPWQDYSLGDRVPVWAKKEGFRQVLGAQGSGSMEETQYQRIYGWTANISDDALETIDPVLTTPGGFSA